MIVERAEGERGDHQTRAYEVGASEEQGEKQAPFAWRTGRDEVGRGFAKRNETIYPHRRETPLARALFAAADGRKTDEPIRANITKRRAESFGFVMRLARARRGPQP